MPFVVESEVADALAARRPVVALESTIIAHGLPWPDNLEVGRALEAAVRTHGAVPATIALVRGRVTIGLSADELEEMAEGRGGRWPKAGAADLGPLAARGQSAALTVSATTLASARIGIRVFATGGIGGVHRGDTGDVSSDLPTLAAHPVAVVSAGCKAILDLPRTLEMLETLGVPVIGVGTDELPAFYTRRSGLRLEHRVDDAAGAARLLHAHWSLGQRGGVLLAHPIAPEQALDEREISLAIAAAVAEAARRGLRGKALTPFLLADLAERTGARSIAANRSLAVGNAGFGAAVAVGLAALPPLA